MTNMADILYILDKQDLDFAGGGGDVKIPVGQLTLYVCEISGARTSQWKTVQEMEPVGW